MSLLVHNSRAVDVGGTRHDCWLYAADGVIRDLGIGGSWRERLPTLEGAAGERALVVDAKQCFLVPGFVDLHAHGGAGHRFEEGPAAIRAALEVHRRHGTTGSVISLASGGLTSLSASLADVAELMRSDPLVLGSHLEGPYLSAHRRGAHDLAALRMPALDEIGELVDAAQGTLRQVTIAPELPGALQVIDFLTSRGVVAALGHTEAGYEQTRRAFDSGATLLTHAFNAMPGMGHRAPGPVVAAFDDDRAYLELINDGHHVDPRMVALAFASAAGRVAMVSDAMAATGAGDGVYQLGPSHVTVTDSVARLSATGQLAGSTVTLDESLRRAVAAGINPVDAVAGVTSVPAEVLGLGHRIGRLDVGYAAHLVLLDADWRVVTVFAAGLELAR